MRRIPIVLLAVLAVFVLGCQKKPVAVVNGEDITEEMLQRQVNQRVMEHGAQGVKVDPKAMRHVAIEQLVAERLLLQGARENSITVSDEEVSTKVDETRARRGEEAFKRDLAEGSMTLEEFKARLKERLIVSKFVASLAPEESIAREDIVKYYRESPTPFLKPEEIHIKILQVHHEEQAEAIAREIEKEKDFDMVADRLDKKNGVVVIGYGWVMPGVFDTVIANAMRNTDEGKHSGPHKGAEGYYFFKVKEKKTEGVKSLDEAKAEIKTVLLSQARQSASMHWVATRKKTAAIKIN